jgi:hypothetical protein
MSRRTITWGVAVAFSLAALLGACGDDDDSSSSADSADETTTTGTDAGPADEQLCEDREAVRDSIESLTDVDVIAEGTSGIEEALADVEASLDALGDSASDELQPEVDELRSALDELETALEDAGSDGVSEVASAAQDVVTAGETLLQRLDELECG